MWLIIGIIFAIINFISSLIVFDLINHTFTGKKDINFYFNSGICVLFLFAAISLSIVSIGCYFLYAIAMWIFYMSFSAKFSISDSIIGLIMCLFIWPQMLASGAFALMYPEVFEKYSKH